MFESLPDDVIINVFDRLKVSLSTVSELQLVSKIWRRFIHSANIAFSVYRREHLDGVSLKFRALFLVSNNENYMGVVYTSFLGGRRSHLVQLRWPEINFPVQQGLLSSLGLIFLVDKLQKVFVLNPTTLRIREICGDFRRAWTYGFGWKDDKRHCNILVKVLDSRMEKLAIFDLQTNTWSDSTVNFEDKEFSVSINEQSTSVFLHGKFFWLGRQIVGDSLPTSSVIQFDPTEDKIRCIPLLPSMVGLDLAIGNMGDDTAGVWSTKPDSSWMWLIHFGKELVPTFCPVPIACYPSGVNFSPLCILEQGESKNSMALLRDHQYIDRYIHLKATPIEIEKTKSPLDFHFQREDRFLGIAFNVSFIPPGDSEVETKETEEKVCDKNSKNPDVEDVQHNRNRSEKTGSKHSDYRNEVQNKRGRSVTKRGNHSDSGDEVQSRRCRSQENRSKHSNSRDEVQTRRGRSEKYRRQHSEYGEEVQYGRGRSEKNHGQHSEYVEEVQNRRGRSEKNHRQHSEYVEEVQNRRDRSVTIREKHSDSKNELCSRSGRREKHSATNSVSEDKLPNRSGRREKHPTTNSDYEDELANRRGSSEKYRAKHVYSEYGISSNKACSGGNKQSSDRGKGNGQGIIKGKQGNSSVRGGNDSHKKRRFVPPKLTREEIDARVKEMQMDAELHERERFKKADRNDAR